MIKRKDENKMTMNERIEKFIKMKVEEHNAVSIGLVYAGDRTDYYKGRLTELQNLLIDFMWQFGTKIAFVTAKDIHGYEYEKAVIIAE